MVRNYSLTSSETAFFWILQSPACSLFVNQKVSSSCGWVNVNRLKVRFGVAIVVDFYSACFTKLIMYSRLSVFIIISS